MKKMLRHSRSGFTLIELLVGMTIFSMALTSIYLLLNSTMKSVSYSRSEIIVSNLLREQMELVRNVRDSNIVKGAGWDAIKIEGIAEEAFTGAVITLDNNFTATGTTWDNLGKIEKTAVFAKKIDIEKDWVGELQDNAVLKEKFEKTQLCFDEQKRYFHCTNDSAVNKTASGTTFASYINIEPMYYYENQTDFDAKNDKRKNIEKDGKSQWFIIDARVIVRDGGNYREYDAKTAITDWQL